MGSVPNSYLDDIRRIVQSVLNQSGSVDVSGSMDHGELSGLADDDHTQYLLAAGTRNITGDIRITGSHSYEMAGNAGDVIEIYADAGDFFIDNLTDSQGLLSIDGDTGLVTLWKGLDINDNVDMNTHDITACGDITVTGGKSLELAGAAGDVIEMYADAGDYFIDNKTDAQGLLWIDGDTGLVTLWKGLDINDNVDMNNHNITDINELWFNASDPGIKFDTGDFIWFDTSEDRIYFEIGGVNICYARSTGFHPVLDSTYYLGSGSAYWKGLYSDDVVVEAGTYMTGDGAGNMELHVAAGKKVEIVVG